MKTTKQFYQAIRAAYCNHLMVGTEKDRTGPRWLNVTFTDSPAPQSSDKGLVVRVVLNDVGCTVAASVSSPHGVVIAKFGEVICDLVTDYDKLRVITLALHHRSNQDAAKIMAVCGAMLDKYKFQERFAISRAVKDYLPDGARLENGRFGDVEPFVRGADSVGENSLTALQKRVADALGATYDGVRKPSDFIEDLLDGQSVNESVFFNLSELTQSFVRTTESGRVEMVPDKCPFNECSNDEYIVFSFNDECSFCFSCKTGASIIDTALAFRGMGGRVTKKLEGDSQDGAAMRRKKVVWLGTYLRNNVDYTYLTNHDYSQVTLYFARKGLNSNYVRHTILPYLNSKYIRYSRVKYSYKTNQYGVAIMVPLMEGKKDIVCIKRRVCDDTIQLDAPRWSFNLYPYDPNVLWSSEDATGSYMVVLVENQLDAAILNCLFEPYVKIKDVVFVAPIALHSTDIVQAFQPLLHSKDFYRAVIAYDCDETGHKFTEQHHHQLVTAGVASSKYYFDADESGSLLDYFLGCGLSADDPAIRDELFESLFDLEIE